MTNSNSSNESDQPDHLGKTDRDPSATAGADVDDDFATDRDASESAFDEAVDREHVRTAAAWSGPAADLIASARSLVRVLASVTAAMQPPRLVVGLLLAASLMVTGRVWDAVAGDRVPADGLTIRAVDAESVMVPPFAAAKTAAIEGTQGIAFGVLNLEPLAVATSFGDVLLGIPIGLWRHDPLFLFGYGLIFAALTGLFGGALARMAACDLAGSERLGAEAGIGFAAACWRSLALAPLAPLLIALLLWSIIILLGVALRWPWLEIVGAVLYGPALILGALVAISLLGYALAFPLLVPAVACERCDAGEAQQRAFAYLLQRPARLAASMALGVVGFAIGYLVVAGVAATTMQVTVWGMSIGAGDAAARFPDGYGPFTLTPGAEVEAEGVSQRTAASLFGLWRTFIVGLVAGWVFSYYYAASTTIYLGLREATDGQEPSEIWRPGMIHGTFVMGADPNAVAQRRAMAKQLESRWRRTLSWIARRRS